MKKERHTRISPTQMKDIPIDKIKGLEDRLKKIEDHIKALEKLTPTYDKDSGSIIIETQKKGENTEK